MNAEPTTPPEPPGGALQAELRARAIQSSATLSENDQRVVAFLNEHFDEIGIHTVESISQGVGVSRAAVVRCARRLGFSGFRELRDRARAEWRGTAKPDRNNVHQLKSLMERKLLADEKHLALIPTLISEHLLADAVATISRGRHVWIVAHRETYGLGLYFHRLLHNVRAEVRLLDVGFLDPLRDLTPEDVVIACTFRPYSRQTVAMLPEVRSSGARLIVVTDSAAQGFLSQQDTVLTVPVDSPSVFLSLVPAVFLFELIAGDLARLDPDRSLEALELTSDLTIRQGLVFEP